ncbi:proenkephalin-A-like [Pholidichthys leucotaenia]
MAAPTQRSCLWMFLLSVFVSSAAAATDCRKECILCLLGQSDLSAMACSLECQGELDSQKLCQDLLTEKENHLPLNTDPHQQPREEEEAGAIMAADESLTMPERQMAKKYGGFMKRYGGFMSRRSSSPVGELENLGNQDDEESIRMELLQFLNPTAMHGDEGDGQSGKMAKRYGGFMRRAEGVAAESDLLETVLGRGLKKRYGGFMRRVGRPEWLVDSSKNGGVLKRAWEDGSDLQKRYGGFMD